MRHVLPMVLMLAVLASGCAAADKDTPAVAAAPTTVAAAMPPGAAGKIGADQVGRVSPVPAFKGGGNGWHIDIQSTGDMRHDVRLRTDRPARVQEGVVVYVPTPATAGGTTIDLDGVLHAAQGDRDLHIRLARDDCTDAAGQVHQHRVQVDIAGEPPLHGCGDLAVY